MKSSLSKILLLLAWPIAVWGGHVEHYSAVLRKDGNFRIEKGLLPDGIVVSQAIFESAINETGWSYLEIIADEADIPDDSRVNIVQTLIRQ